MTWPCVGHVVHLEDCDKLAGWGPDGIFEMFLLAVFIYYCFKVTFIDATMKWIYNMKCNIKLLFSLASSWLKSLRERQRVRERGREREREAERVRVCVCVWWLWVRAEKRANENCLEVEIEGTTKNIVCHIIMKNFNRRTSHGHYGSKRRKLTWIARIHSHTFINTVKTTLCEAPPQLLQNLESNFYFEGTWEGEQTEKTPDRFPANWYHIILLEDKIQRPRWESNPHPLTLVISLFSH